MTDNATADSLMLPAGLCGLLFVCVAWLTGGPAEQRRAGLSFISSLVELSRDSFIMTCWEYSAMRPQAVHYSPECMMLVHDVAILSRVAADPN